MTNLTYAQLEGLWINAGGNPNQAPLMAAIAEAESGGNPGALNATDNGGRQSSFGLWQISNGTHTPPSPNWNNPAVNASLAVQKYNSQGLGAWGTYTSGAYKAFLNGSTTPDTSASAAGGGAVDTSAAGGAAAAAAAQAEANCAWRINFNIPLIGGDLCVISYSQMRAILGGLMLAAGGAVALFGVASLIAQTGAPAAAARVGGGAAELAGGALAAVGAPEVGAPVAAAGSAARRKGRTARVARAAGRSAQRKRSASRAQDRRDESVARQVEGRRRDSAKGPALRDEAPF